VNGNIYLIGMPGSGKSRVGREIAQRMSVPFVDLDGMIEEEAARSIVQIFEDQGEAVFRELEKSALSRVSSRSRAVVACGGGVVLDEENRAVMRATGRVVWLDVPLDMLRKRVRPGDRRPLVASDDDLERLLKEREPLYRELADVAVSGREDVRDMVSAVMEALD
jgi:shikimate kinase